MSSPSTLAKLRIVAINDVYELANLPKFQTFLKQLEPRANSIVLPGDFLSPSTLSSIDGGRGMVATLRACGLTHVTLGNHEADLQWPMLKNRIEDLCRPSGKKDNRKKGVTFINTNLREAPPSTGPEEEEWFLAGPMAPPYAIVPTPCGRVNVALLGLISDEKTVFRDKTFRGAPISDVLSSYQDAYEQIIPTGKADFVIPLTHMSMGRDKELAQTIMSQMEGSQNRHGIIIGGHEHEPYDIKVYANGDTDEDDNSKNTGIEHDNDKEPYVRILKSGTEAENATLIDLTFDENKSLIDITADIISMEPYEPSHVVQQIADHHMQVLNKLDKQIIINAETLLPPGTPLSSVRSRHEQTTVGAVLCKAIKDELGPSICDVAMINGATIKGGAIYPNDKISYAALKKELPFPTKIVVVQMKRWELLEAIHYSRKYNEEGVEVRPGKDIPRRGYLQVDLEFEKMMDNAGPLEDTVRVALPRNLMAGFCQIKPLMDLGKELKEEGLYPGSDDYVPALQLIIRHFCKSMWMDIVKESFTFEDIDTNNDGLIDRDEIKVMMEKFLGHEPPEFVVDDMLDAIDHDENGLIDAGEFSFLMATMEREDLFRKI